MSRNRVSEVESRFLMLGFETLGLVEARNLSKKDIELVGTCSVMTAATSTSSSRRRYASPDPTLPKPWRGLVDGCGYLYFWNTATNVTQYERPDSTPTPDPSAIPAMNSSRCSSSTSSVEVQQSPSSSDPRGEKQNSSGGDGQNGRKNDSPGSEDHQRELNAPGCPLSIGMWEVVSLCIERAEKSQLNMFLVCLCKPSSSTRVHIVVVVGMHKQGSAVQSMGSTRMLGNLDVTGGSSAESYRRQHEITIKGDDVPAPLMTFHSTGFPLEILREVRQAGFSAPTPIQAQSWPIALKGRDIVAVAKTGSGKTLGYLIPGFIHLKRQGKNSKMGPTVLILSPTRELATQIQNEAEKFGRSSRISCTCLYGGAPKGPQLRDLDRGTDIVVATPGRLNDILELGRVSLQQVSYLILDEADRMLDMGFEPQIRKIVKQIPARRQTLMYTATWPKEVRKIASDLLVNPVQVNIGNIDELVANKSITQHVEVISPMEKQRRLEQILQSHEPGSKVIIFCSTKKMCDQLAHTLTRQFGAAAIHGDKSQADRDRVLSQFRTGQAPVLVATDVAARGLDIKDIKVVINYDFPTGIEDYVHRIGRTGRAGAKGVAYTFFSDRDAKYAGDLIKVLEGADQRVPSQILKVASHGSGSLGRSFRWGSGSGGHDSSRSYGSGKNDSSYNSKSEWDPPSSGWSERHHNQYESEYHGRGGDASIGGFEGE
ncbi:DEAD-box ATP-dependent RNA helicase 14 [Asimina triloba]